MTVRQRRAARQAGQPVAADGFDAWFELAYAKRPSDKSRTELVDEQDKAHRVLAKAKKALAAMDAWESARAIAEKAWRAKP